MTSDELNFKNIRTIRILKGIKSETMAKELGISKGEYSKIENGQRKNISAHLNKILILLDIDNKDILNIIKTARTIYNQ